MPIVDAYAERKYQAVMEDTWGHLKAKPNTDIPGFLIFTHSLEGYTVLIEFEFDLDSSPWLHEDTEDLMESHCEKTDFDRGSVYRFDGRYKVYKNGRRRFIGKFRKLKSLRNL